MSSKVHYNETSLIPPSHLGWTNEMQNVTRLRLEEIVHKNQHSKLGYKTMLWPQQSHVGLLQNILCQFTNPVDLVLDLGYWTIATGWACFLLPQHRQWWDLKGSGLHGWGSAIVSWEVGQETSEQAIRFDNLRYYFGCRQDSAWSSGWNRRKKRANVWAVPKKHSPVQKFSNYFLHVLWMYFKEKGLLRNNLNLRCFCGVRQGGNI